MSTVEVDNPQDTMKDEDSLLSVYNMTDGRLGIKISNLILDNPDLHIKVYQALIEFLQIMEQQAHPIVTARIRAEIALHDPITNDDTMH